MNHEELRDAYSEVLAARKRANREQCPTPAELARLAGAEGEESARLTLLDHAMDCPDCRHEFELLRALAAARLRAAWWRSTPVAIAALLALAIGLGAIWQLRKQSLHEDTFRGGSDVAVIVPGPGAQQAQPVMFAWHPVEGATSYAVIFVTESGTPSVRRETTDTTLNVSDELPTGSFRWWVSAVLQDGRTVESRPRLLRVTP